MAPSATAPACAGVCAAPCTRTRRRKGASRRSRRWCARARPSVCSPTRMGSPSGGARWPRGRPTRRWSGFARCPGSMRAGLVGRVLLRGRSSPRPGAHARAAGGRGPVCALHGRRGRRGLPRVVRGEALPVHGGHVDVRTGGLPRRHPSPEPAENLPNARWVTTCAARVGRAAPTLRRRTWVDGAARVAPMPWGARASPVEALRGAPMRKAS